MAMAHFRWIAAAILVGGAVALVIVPVDATFLNSVGSDTVEYRTGSCGSPVASLLGSDPDVLGTSQILGEETSAAACEAASAKRSIAALTLLLTASIVLGLSNRRIQHPVRRRGEVPDP